MPFTSPVVKAALRPNLSVGALRPSFKAGVRFAKHHNWLTRCIQINREIAAAIPPITDEDVKSLRNFSEHLNRLANKADKSGIFGINL